MTTPAVGSADYFASIGISNPAQARRGNAEVGQNDFLRLMLEQLRNQDPLDPQKGAEFVAQLAQFSTVSGIEKLSAGFGELVDSLRGSQALSAAGLVGSNALVRAQSFALPPADEAAGATPATAGATRGIAGAVDVTARGAVTVEVVDSTGAVVHSVDLGSRQPGLADFAWNGRLANGRPAPGGEYTVRARANGAEAPVLLQGRVRSVSVGAEGAVLALEGIGNFPVNGVRRFG